MRAASCADPPRHSRCAPRRHQAGERPCRNRRRRGGHRGRVSPTTRIRVIFLRHSTQQARGRPSIQRPRRKPDPTSSIGVHHGVATARVARVFQQSQQHVGPQRAGLGRRGGRREERGSSRSGGRGPPDERRTFRRVPRFEVQSLAPCVHAARADEASRELGGTANAGATKSPAPSPSLPRPRIRTRRPIALAVSIALSRAARKTADDLTFVPPRRMPHPPPLPLRLRHRLPPPS